MLLIVKQTLIDCYLKRNSLDFFLLLLSLVLVNNINGQNFSQDYLDIINNKGFKERDSAINFLIGRQLSVDSVEIAISTAHKYSILNYREGNYNNGLIYVLWEKGLYEEFNLINKDYINCIFNAGLFSYNNQEYSKSASFFREVISKDIFNLQKNKAYFELGRSLNMLGDYSKALGFFEKRLRSLEGSNDFNRIVSVYINMSNVLNNINSEESLNRSIQLLKIADSISNVQMISPNRKLNLNSAIASVYSNKFSYDFKKAREYHMKNLYMGRKYNHKPTILRTLNNLSYLYNIEQLDSVEYFITTGLNYAKTPEETARLYDNLADFNIWKGNLNQAKRNIHNSLEIMTSSKFTNVPTITQLRNSILLSYSLHCLKKTSEIELRLFHHNNKDIHLELAINNVKMAEQVVHLLFQDTSEEATQLIWSREASQAYLYGAYASHLKGDSKQAFEFMEKNKALLLSESVLRNTEFANLPKHISDKETNQKKKIYNLESRLNEDADNISLQDSLFIAKQSHEKFVNSLKIEFPKYFDRKINVDQIPLADMQKELASNEAVVSYIWNDFDRDKELIVGLIAAKDSAITFLIEDVDQLKLNLLKYRELISKPFSTVSDQVEFQSVAYNLYQQLFPSIDIETMIASKDLMIMADGLLQNIPFESLIIEENSNEYLILNGNIHYLNSYSFLKHNEKRNRKSKNLFVGYSPVSFKDSTLVSLKESEYEILSIQSKLNGDIKINESATKEDFLNNSSDKKIIHLATHADAGKNPWIAFADQKLELHELYTYKNNAELVALSACNTSLGEMAKGEGVFSLARGFFYSGSESVVSSLWEVNDKTSSEIMGLFYDNLLHGQPKTEALNNAKRTFLQNHSLSEQSPYYWSSFILIGDSKEIDINTSNYLLYCLLLLFIPVGYIFRAKLKKIG